MGAAIAGLLIAALFFSGALMMFRTNLFGSVLVGVATQESVRISGERARTEIRIATTTVSGDCNIAMEVDNTGATSVVDISLMDVIVQFPDGNNPARRLTYVGSGPPNIGEWAATSITGQFEPGIFNPGETMTIGAQLSLIEAGAGTATVGTPNGIIDTASFPTLTPCP